MSRFVSLNIWSGNPLDGGTLVAEFADAVDRRVVFDIEQTNEQLSFRYPRTSSADTHCTEGRYIERKVVDGSVVGTDTTSYWVIERISRNTDDGMVSVVCLPLVSVLSNHMLLEIVDGFPVTTVGLPDGLVDDQIAEMLDKVEPDVSSWVDAAPATRGAESIAYNDSNVTVLEWCKRFAQRIGAEFRGAYRVATANLGLYFLDAIGFDAPVVYVETAKNLVAVQREQNWSEAATVCLPEDEEGRGVWNVAWRVSAVSGDDIELEDPQERDVDPVPYDGCLDGMYLIYDQASMDGQLIVSSTAPNMVELDTGGGAFVSVDDICVLRNGGLVNRISELENTESSYPRKLVRVRPPGITATRNLVKNAFMREYAGAAAAPDGWTFTNTVGTGATIARSTTDTEYGGFSARLIGHASNQTHELTTPIFWNWDTGQDGLHCIRCRIVIDALPGGPAQVLVTFNASASSGSGTTTAITLAAVGIHEVACPNVDLSSFSSGLYLHVLVNGTGASTAGSDVYVDVLQVTPGGTDPQVFVESSDANLLWRSAHMALEKRTPSVKSYRIGFNDLARVDDTVWSADSIVLGGSVSFLSDLETSRETLRIVRYEIDDDNPANSVLTVAPQRRTFAGAVAESRSMAFNPGAVALALAREIDRTTFSEATILAESVVENSGSPTGDLAPLTERAGAAAVSASLKAAGRRFKSA